MAASIGQVKQEARTLLLGHWNEHVPFSIVLITLELVCAVIPGMFTQRTTLALVFSLTVSAILQLLLGLFYAGAKLHFLKCLRQQPGTLADLAAPFTMQPDRFLITGLIRLAISLLLFAPLYLAGPVLPLAGRALVVFDLVWILLAALLFLAVRSLFALSDFLLLEHPEMGAIESLRESARRMKGQVGRFMGLVLSFIGYGLLGICSMGLGFLWVIPYAMTSFTVFYSYSLTESGQNPA